MERCLVTGATGFVGSHLVDGLLARGRPVSCTVRSSSDTRWLKGNGAQLLPCDIADVAQVKRALRGVSTVFHVAGAIAAPSYEVFARVNEGLTRSVVEACASIEPAPRLVYVSSIAAAGPSLPGQPRSEEMPAQPVSDYGRSKHAGESVVAEFTNVPATIVRPPIVYGPRDRGLLPVFRLARLPIRPKIGGERQVSLVAVEDLVAGLILAARSNEAVGETYFLTHPESMSMAELGALLSKLLGARGLTFPVPALAITAAASVVEPGARLLGFEPSLTRDKAREMTQARWVCDGSKAQRQLDFVAQTAHADGLAATAEWYRRAGWL
jgi:nucleoside-diphosphate-sugar epimerase